MFDINDFKHLNKMSNNMADGMVDGSASHIILEMVVDTLSNTDYGSDTSRMELMMKCINICYAEDNDSEVSEERVFSVILGLCFNYSNIMSNLVTDGFDVNSYFNFIKTEILPVMREESLNIPYWDIDEE